MAAVNHRDNCKLCGWIQSAAEGELKTLLWETPEAICVVGEHQYFPGYAMIISKTHVREMHTLPKDVSSGLFRAVLDLGEALDRAYKPWKINYASLGNVEEHLHWHVIPRYESDPDHKDQPWKHAGDFMRFKTTTEQILQVKAKLKR